MGAILSILATTVGLTPRFSLRSRTFASPLGKTHFVLGRSGNSITLGADRCTDKEHAKRPITSINTNGTYISEVLFSPHDNLQGTLINLIEQEKKQIQVAIFMLTDDHITNALIEANRRGVLVEVITDKGTMHDKFSKIPRLKHEKIPVFAYCPAKESGILNNIMHNKFVVFHENLLGTGLVWTGSFNFTKSAQERNQENVVILNYPSVIERFQKKFEDLKKYISENKKS